LAPQKAQNGIVASTAWPQEEQVRLGAAPEPDVPPPAGPYTLVAGAPLGPASEGIAMADMDSGLPQSMQKREPGSLLRPQCAQVITFRVASEGEEPARNERQYTGRFGGWSTHLN
jgi:hypothetical protein